MVEKALNICIQSITACADWFTEILDAVEGGKFYVAMVFIVLVCGFLLSRFQVAMYVGSDVVDKGVSAYRRATEPRQWKPKDGLVRYQAPHKYRFK